MAEIKLQAHNGQHPGTGREGVRGILFAFACGLLILVSTGWVALLLLADQKGAAGK